MKFHKKIKSPPSQISPQKYTHLQKHEIWDKYGPPPNLPKHPPIIIPKLDRHAK